jgi:putative Mg2+ transporter-C (MgtC) family protein
LQQIHSKERRKINMFADVDWYLVFSHLWHLALAFVLALPLGWNREHRSRSAGLRTFPLVAVGACAFMLIGLSVFQQEEAQSRIIYGIVTGIGFIGGGAILKGNTDGMVVGTATAASIWNTGAIGVAVAWDKIEIALMLMILNFFTFYFVTPLKDRVHH